MDSPNNPHPRSVGVLEQNKRLVMAPSTNLKVLSKALVDEAIRPEELRRTGFLNHSLYCNSADTSILEGIQEIPNQQEKRLDLLNATVTSTQKSYARFFEHSLKAFKGGLSKK